MDTLSLLMAAGLITVAVVVLWLVIIKPIRDGTVDKDSDDDL